MSSIVAAAMSETVSSAAIGYLAHNLSVVPCMGKRASVNWKQWAEVRPPQELVYWWHHKGWMPNIAIVCGEVSQNLVVIDLDGMDAVKEFERKFHLLIDTFNVISGSGKGKHYYYRVKDMPKNVLVKETPSKGFEVRGNGCYVVAPPSKHPDTGQYYKVERYREIMSLPDLNEVRAWIAEKVPVKQVEKMPSIGEVRQATPYAKRALELECGIVTGAPKGLRNRTLFMAALKMGNLIDSGWISRSEVENDLLGAASHLSSDDGEYATWRTIYSGIETGIARNNRRRA